MNPFRIGQKVKVTRMVNVRRRSFTGTVIKVGDVPNIQRGDTRIYEVCVKRDASTEYQHWWPVDEVTLI
jgi:hypothetical protein